MKITSAILLTTIALCAGLCCPEEDDYNGHNYTVENDALLSVEGNVSTLNLGDTLYFETAISDTQSTTTNENISISDFTQSGEPITYSLLVYKLNSYGNFDRITLNDDSITTIEGSVFVVEDPNNPYLQLKTVLTENTYKNKFGVTVLEAGTYYIGGDFNTYNGKIGIYTTNEFGTLNITTKIVNSNTEGRYIFTIN
ncbi:hypothetical protein ES677_06440 [Bizionia gelidisalsuginis]|uniref:Lipoprotein n=1 Tax=Bizionia gelidisalsuginis TaxID=291188 RepID=A0ABY3MBI5_9FLAO|nr:hypothetical protein [Bizionia gelidisalsuginis]TYC14177.1 hypothetical protein ES677_06440 [Bizionia gelidisalsuginis]